MTDTHSRMFLAYVDASLFYSTDDNDKPLDRDFSLEDIPEETISKMKNELEDFIRLVGEEGIDLADWGDDQIGIDFWLTRNGHGAGFWDRGLPFGDELTKLAKTFGSADLYVGDDGKIYQQ